MKRSVNRRGAGVGAARNRSHSRAASPRSAYSHLGDRLRRVGDARRVAPPAVEHRRDSRGCSVEVAGQRPPALAAEALHAPRHVGGEAGARLLAVVADVDAGLELLGHDVRAPPASATRSSVALVDGLAPVLADEQVAQRGRAREAADVGDEDAVVAAVHAVSSRPGPARPARAAWRWPRGRRARRCAGSRTGRSRSRCVRRPNSPSTVIAVLVALLARHRVDLDPRALGADAGERHGGHHVDVGGEGLAPPRVAGPSKISVSSVMRVEVDALLLDPRRAREAARRLARLHGDRGDRALARALHAVEPGDGARGHEDAAAVLLGQARPLVEHADERRPPRAP